MDEPAVALFAASTPVASTAAGEAEAVLAHGTTATAIGGGPFQKHAKNLFRTIKIQDKNSFYCQKDALCGSANTFSSKDSAATSYIFLHTVHFRNHQYHCVLCLHQHPPFAMLTGTTPTLPLSS